MSDVEERKQARARCLTIYAFDMDQARLSCSLLSSETRDDYRGVLLRDVVLSYSRPFSVNEDEEGRKSALKSKFVPKEMRVLHRELLALRNQVFAHSDMTFRRPSVTIWRNDTGELHRVVGFSDPQYQQLCARHATIRQLIEAVGARIEHELSNLLSGSGLLLG